MKTLNNKRTNRPLKIVLFCTAGLLVLFSAYYFASFKLNTWPNETQQINSSPATEAEIDAGNQSKSDTVNNDEKDSSGSDTPVAPVTDASGNTSTTEVNITSVNQSSSDLSVKVLIQTILSGGECTITMKNGARNYTSTVTIQALPSTSTCEGFTIPLNQLSQGTWATTISIKSGSVVGAASQDIKVE